MRHLARWTASLLLGIAVSACGGGGGSSGGTTTPPTNPPAANRGTLLQDTLTAYPRLVRLANQLDASRNGRILSSNTQNVSGTWQAAFHESRDGGTTFTRIAAILDPDFQAGICCGSLFEMPQTVGALAKGTLLYSASVGADQTAVAMEDRIYASTDGGATWARQPGVHCGRGSRIRGGNGTGIWEPEFFIAGDGSLACVFSDETLDGHSQVLRIMSTTDGQTWSAARTIVQGQAASDRPGMAVVRRLGATGRFLMTYEWCSTAGLDCSARYQTSADGLTWGALGTQGIRIETATGQFFRHTPTHTWTARSGSPNGVILLTGQILVNNNGTVDTANTGNMLMVNTTADASGAWKLVPAPITMPAPPSATNWCQNYSTPLLASPDGTQVLMMQTDGAADASCRARFGAGAFQP